MGGLYVNRRHFETVPRLTGWWGYLKERQFDMLHDWAGAGHAGAWQISTPPVLSTVPLLGSLKMFSEAGIEEIRRKSLAQTDYLMELLEATGLLGEEYGYGIGTPREATRRGGHIAVEHREGMRIARALKQRKVIPDFRPPDIVRLAPIALYTSYQEIWQSVQHLRAIIDGEEYLALESDRELVS